MDRIDGPTTIDLGGGRRGFRGKDTVAGIAGTEVRAKWLNGMQEEAIGLVEKAGLVPDAADLSQLAQAVQSGRMNYAVAGGSANAWTVGLSLALTAYRAGRVLWIRAPATNTSTAVTVTIDTLPARTVKKANGAAPAVGDLVSGRWYPTIDDGANVCVVGTLPSDIAAIVPIAGNWLWSQTIANAVTTKITSYSGDGANNLADATFSGGDLTIGAVSAGLWMFLFSAVATNATTDMVATNMHSGSGAIGYSTSQTATSAPGTTAVNVRRMVAGESMSFTLRQIIGSSQACSGRLNAFRLGA